MIRPRFILSISGASIAVATAVAATVSLMSIQVRKAEIRDTPSFLGAVIATLNYADKVTVVQQEGSWFQVALPNSSSSGWLHSSALSRKTIVMTAGEAAPTGASSGEMALAGKGFNADVEAQFKSGHKDIDFAWVDRMERIKIPPKKLQAFAREGGLIPGLGGAP